jgi:hypothetical protein
MSLPIGPLHPRVLARRATAWLVILLPALTVLSSGVAAADPTITTQPASQTIASGTTATLSVTASGTPVLLYQWYIGPSGTTTSPIPGAIGPSYTTPALTSTTSYWVRVANLIGHLDSNTATITVANPPTITTQPSSQTIVSGATATLSATASGTAPLSYQWYIGASGTVTNPISGATGDSYTTPALTSTTSYWVRVTNSAGHVDSSTATVTVITPPRITTQPASQTIVSGGTATLSVTASGTAPLRYQWYIGSSGSLTDPIGGATARTYTTPALTSTTSYWVRVSNTAGTADSDTATVTVITPPTMTTQPASQTIVLGAAATLTVTASGTLPLTYQWYIGASGATTNPIGGATDSSYTTPPLTDTTSYWVRVSNTAGTADSNTASITVVTLPTITTQPADQAFVSGSVATLSVGVVGTPPLSYQWYLGPSGTTTNPIAGATGSSYTTAAVTSTTSYWVRISNGFGIADSITATLTVVTPPAITTQPAAQTIASGRAATLSVTASGSGLSYQWYLGTSGTTTNPISGATGSSYTTPALTSTTSYWVRVSNVLGTADSSTATMTVRTLGAHFDGDARTDLAVFRPSNGTWYIRYASLGYATSSAGAFQWGLPGDIPIAGDFDGDAKTDLAVFRPSNGTWYIRYSSLGYGTDSAGAFQWGLPGDIPIAGDFDGDGQTDLTVFRPSNGTWYIRYSSLGYSIAAAGVFQWGLPGDIPLADDFDGDGKTDFAVWRPSNGTWYIRYSSLGYSVASAGAFQWGLPGDVPIAGDFDGDGKTDLAVYRPSIGEWFILYSSQGYSVASFSFYQWGLPGDVPISADFDGDGKIDLAVFRPSTGEWFILYSSLGYSIAGSGHYQWGLPGDVAVQ